MSIHLGCEGCGRLLSVKEALAGRRIKCPHCGAIQTVPKGALTEEEAATGAGPGRREPAGEARPNRSRAGAAVFLVLAFAALAVNVVLLMFGVFLPVVLAACPAFLLSGLAGLVKPDLTNFLLVDAGWLEGDKSAYSLAVRAAGIGIFVVGFGIGLVVSISLMGS
jgi:phage FluMu protein Com